jgi:hypothetical protein
MVGRKVIVAAGLVAMGIAGMGAQKASAHDGVYGGGYAGYAGGYGAPQPAYTLPYVPAGYGSPVYNTPADHCATPAPATAYCPPAPVVRYCPPPAPVVVYRPAPVWRPRYAPYPVYGRDRVQVSFEFRNRW